MKIEVTQADIDQAKRMLIRPGTFNDKFWDPIANAIRRTLEAKFVMVHPYTAEVDGQFYTISNEATELGLKWAQGQEVEPITFAMLPKEIDYQRKPKA